MSTILEIPVSQRNEIDHFGPWTTGLILASENHYAYTPNCDERNQTDLNCDPRWVFCRNNFEPSSINLNCERKNDATIFQCIDNDVTVSINDLIMHSNDVKEICEVFDFLSEGSITTFSPKILGVYSLEDYLYNNKVVYVNKDTGVYLYYDSNFNESIPKSTDVPSSYCVSRQELHQIPII